MPEEHLFTRRDVAEHLGVSPRTVDRLVATGELPVVRIGRSVRFRPETVDAFAARHETAA